MTTDVQKVIEAHRAMLKQLRAQRQFRDYSRKVINLSAVRPNPLLGRSSDPDPFLTERALKAEPRRFTGEPISLWTALNGQPDFKDSQK